MQVIKIYSHGSSNLCREDAGDPPSNFPFWGDHRSLKSHGATPRTGCAPPSSRRSSDFSPQSTQIKTSSKRLCATAPRPNPHKDRPNSRSIMSQHGGDALGASPPGRPRHQIKRSISEISSPSRLHRHHSHRAGKETDRDARTATPQSAIPVVQPQRSLEWSRSEGVTPNLTPSPSRRTSVLYASADEAMPAIRASRGTASLDGLVREQQKAAARERFVQQLPDYLSCVHKPMR